jgi:hypothetical protein
MLIQQTRNGMGMDQEWTRNDTRGFNGNSQFLNSWFIPGSFLGFLGFLRNPPGIGGGV